MRAVDAAPHRPQRQRLAYFVGAFPQLTETFVLREIAELSRHGFEIRVFAVRRADHGQLPRSLCDTTLLANAIYARPDRFFHHCRVNLTMLVTRPRRYLAGLRLFLSGVHKRTPAEIGRLLSHFFIGVGFGADLVRLGLRHVHCHFATATEIALAAHLVTGVSFSFAAHASADIYMRPMLLNEKLRRAAFVVPVCEYNRRFLDSVSGFRYSPKLHVIHNGIEVTEMSSLIQGQELAGSVSSLENGFRIVSVGRLIEMKGHATLVEACGKLLERGVEVECVIIGDGPERENLARLISRCGLRDRVRLAGPKSLAEIYAVLCTADVFVLLSQTSLDGFRDAFPTVLLEAMVARLPIVATWVSGIPEIVINKVTGLLVHERDPAAAAAALEQLARSPALRREWGEAGYRRVREEFALDRSVAKLQHLFDSVLGTPFLRGGLVIEKSAATASTSGEPDVV